MKDIVNKWPYDYAIALSAFGEHDYNSKVPIERDASGVPIAWRVAPYGPWKVTKNGESFVLLDVTEQVVDQIISYYQARGNKVPLDSRHFLYRLAEKYNVDEMDVIRMLPDGRGTFGFGELEKRPDGLWIKNVEYVPLGRELIGEGIFRYFSPVVRGLSSMQYRITSIAFENVPATDNMLSFAAAAEDETLDLKTLNQRLDALALSAENKETKPMNKLLKAVAGLLGVDSIALGAGNDIDDNIIDKLKTVQTELDAGRTFCKNAADVLALSGEIGFNALEGAVRGLASKAATADDLKSRVDTLALESETRKRDDLINQGLQKGNLTDAMVDWAKTKDSIFLSEYIKIAPPVIPLDKINRDNLKKDDAVALTAEDREVCRLTGISEEDFLKHKKGE